GRTWTCPAALVTPLQPAINSKAKEKKGIRGHKSPEQEPRRRHRGVDVSRHVPQGRVEVSWGGGEAAVGIRPPGFPKVARVTWRPIESSPARQDRTKRMVFFFF
ncbi:hypothetical protein CSHISOI_11799, partial [Colletotrichum shisoi]